MVYVKSDMKRRIFFLKKMPTTRLINLTFLNFFLDFQITNMPPKKNQNQKEHVAVSRVGKQTKQVRKKRAPRQTQQLKQVEKAKTVQDDTTEIPKQNNVTQKNHEVCVVLYCNGTMSYFETGEEDARIKHSCMGTGVVEAYKPFLTEEEAKFFMNNNARNLVLKSILCPDNSAPTNVVSPDRTALKTQSRSPLAKVQFAIGKMLDANVDIICNDTKPAATDSKHRGYLDFVQKTSLTAQVKLDVKIFKYQGNNAPKFQVVAFDLMNIARGQTYWAHNSARWADVFSAAKQNYNDMYDPICYKFKSFHVRDINDTSDRNAYKMVNVVNNKTSRSYRLYRFGLYVTLPHALTEEEVMKELCAFNTNARKEYAMEAYMLNCEASSPALKACLLPHTGDYWKVLNSAFSVHPTITYMGSLDTTFRDGVITELMKELFNEERHPLEYDDISCQQFAYGVLMANANA